MPKKDKIKLIVGLLVIFVILFSGLLFSFWQNKEETSLTVAQNEITEKAIQNEPPTEKPIAKNTEATLDINGAVYKAHIETNTSVYDFMNNLRGEGKVDFKDKTYIGLGKFIDEINGIRGDGSRFWIYYVNGQKAKIGVSNYKINPGDVVSWKYEKDID